MPFTRPSELEPPPSAPRFSRWLELARRRWTWLLLALGLIALVSWITVSNGLPRVDQMLQESALNLVRPGASNDIVIVAIDDKSIEAIGRWPWRRALHAEVLRQISRGESRCIGLDLLLAGPDTEHPGDKALLARRMKEAGYVVLPIALQVSGRNANVQTETLPSPELARAATALGHAHLGVDEDGAAQRVYLREGFPGSEWPHFALALQQAARGRLAPQPPLASGAATSPPAARWRRHQHELLPVQLAQLAVPSRLVHRRAARPCRAGAVPSPLCADRHYRRRRG